MILDDNAVALAGPDYDQPPAPLTRLVVVAATARTGSYMLGRMLGQLSYGIALEYYNPIYRSAFASRWNVEKGPRFAADYLAAIIRHRTLNTVCALKCMPPDRDLLSDGLGAIDPSRVRYVHIWRRDHLAQGISLRLARQSGVWTFTPDPTTAPKPGLDVADLEALKRACVGLATQELAWRVFLGRCGAPVAHVAYEDLVADREREMHRLVGFLDPGRALPSPLMLREPPSGAGLRARQHVSEDERATLREAYETRFGPIVPLAEPA